MTKTYDLHCHSNCSDGILSPEELVSRAKLKEVQVLALTDHDTVSGYDRAAAQAEQEGIELIAGVEFSSVWNGRGVHIVGLNLDMSSPILKTAIHYQAKARIDRAELIAEKLHKHGIKDALEGAKRYADGGSIGRPHFAKHLVEAGYVTNMNQAFKRYLGAGKPGDVKQSWPEIEQIVDWVTGAAGVAVLAHPAKYDMTRTKLCSLVEQFKSVGGKAIEIVSGKQEKAITDNLVKIANKYELFGSCGSDFHSPVGAWQELGGFGAMPDSVPAVWQCWEHAS